MKHQFLTYCLLLVSSFLFAQKSPWGFGVKWSYDAVGINRMNEELIEAKPKAGFNVALLVDYEISDRLLVSTGLGFNKFSYKINNYTFDFGCDYVGMGGFDPYNSYLSGQNDIRSLVIPISASIYFGKKQSQFYLNPGLTILKAINQGNIVETVECGQLTAQSSTNQNFYQIFQVRSVLNLGYELALNSSNKKLNRLRYQIEFGASYFLTSGFDIRFTNSHFWSWGGAIGVRYDLAANRAEMD